MPKGKEVVQKDGIVVRKSAARGQDSVGDAAASEMEARETDSTSSACAAAQGMAACAGAATAGMAASGGAASEDHNDQHESSTEGPGAGRDDGAGSSWIGSLQGLATHDSDEERDSPKNDDNHWPDT